MARFQFPLMSALPLLVLTAAISTIGDELSAQPVNGHIVLARDGVDASDFDGVHYKIPYSTILFQSDEGPNFFLGYFRGKLVAVERGSNFPIRIARDQVAQSVSTNPTEENWTLLGIIEEFLRHLEPAREAAGQALKLNPQNVDAMFVIALVNYRESEYEDCVAICDDALVLAPDRLDIAARRAAALVPFPV